MDVLYIMTCNSSLKIPCILFWYFWRSLECRAWCCHCHPQWPDFPKDGRRGEKSRTRILKTCNMSEMSILPQIDPNCIYSTLSTYDEGSGLLWCRISRKTKLATFSSSAHAVCAATRGLHVRECTEVKFCQAAACQRHGKTWDFFRSLETSWDY